MAELPKLDYGYEELEPHLSKEMMEVHHSKHHQAYVDKLNATLEGTSFDGKDAEAIIKGIDYVSEDIKQAVINFAGGHINHSMYWKIMSPNGGGEPSGKLGDAITTSFGSFPEFKEKLNKIAGTFFGSGWAWVVKDKERLEILGLPNQDSPLLQGKTPIMCIDVWEHAYYLQYKWQRPAYIEAWWNVVNWKDIERRFLRD